MAKSIKKELKRPDEFVSFWTRFGAAVAEMFETRKRAIVIGATAAATVVVGSVVFSEFAERRAVQATQGLEKVQKVLTADLIPEPPPGAPPATPPKDDGQLHFKSERERLEAALKEVDAFLAAQPSGALHVEGELQRGEILLALDRTDEALKLYEPLAADGSKLDGRLRFLAREGLGYAYERKGDLDRALATFSKLGDDATTMSGFYKDRAMYQKARIAEVRGNRDEAARLYHEVLDKTPTTSLRDEINNRLAVLELK